jgi:uncharacterized membrane protein required for colicin V production
MWFPEQLYTIDILFAALVLLFVFEGIKHGLSSELAHVVTLIALLAGFCFFYPQLTQLASDHWQTLPPSAVQIAVSALMLLAAVLLFVLLRALFKQLLKNKLGEAADKIAGGLAGALRGALVGLVVLVGLSLIPNDSLYQTLSEKSSVGGWACNTLAPWAKPRIMELPVLKDKMSEKLNDITQ